jgi:hypothetical protein
MTRSGPLGSLLGYRWPTSSHERDRDNRVVDGWREDPNAAELSPAASFEVAVGVVMECLAFNSGEARSYLLRRAHSEARDVDDLARDIVQRRQL